MNDSATATDPDAPPPFGQRNRTHTGLSTIASQSVEWQEQNLLSLDGGGIRGYWSLLVLKRLMEAIGDAEREQEGATPQAVGAQQAELHSFLPFPYPENATQCDISRITKLHERDAYSLIAMMLSRFRMTVMDCLNEYERMSNRIFGRPRWFSQRNLMIPWWTKYSAAAMEKAFEEVTIRRSSRRERQALDSQNHADPKFETTHGTCSTFATTIRRSTGGTAGSERSLHLLRSYRHENRPGRTLTATLPVRNFGPAESMRICQVARAATAAPFYFKEIVFRPNGSNETVYYSDGGFGSTNNPTAVAIQEIRLHGNGRLGAIVSIGTAKADTDSGRQSARAHVERAFDAATNPSEVHVTVLRQDHPHYWRLNDEKGLELPLDDWKPTYFTGNPGSQTMQTIKDKFAHWIADRDVIEMFNACASELVKRRRARAQLRHRWERFSTGASGFQCQDPGCSSEHENFYHRGRFLEHWQTQHDACEEFKEPLFTDWTYQARP
ncbi:FabD/lysophospholipase-like protein [Bimuria novae-zelandiae CBS 107.79]|uniref:FabD/lysophospholipase-like protein n=1 Tax=Bimuria novae-zelandiae CBS 107.79 TaxID=1447943 RepID=A0A6A5VQK6_9PLEO|nr:FabD/lysophospholipase-like protein [Bimuria novae-zelandiae CBS 107.79]